MACSHGRNLAPIIWVLALFCLLISGWPLLAQDKTKSDAADPPKKKAGPAPGAAVDVRLVDDSTLRLTSAPPERIELETAYGKLLIPVADIQRIDVGLRLPEDLRKKVDAAIVDLGSGDFRRRQTATADLIALRVAYQPPRGEQGDRYREDGSDPEVDFLEKIRAAVPAEILDIPPYDVVHTANSKIAGRIKSDVLRVSTLAFGEQQVKLTDIRSVRSQNFREVEAPADGSVLEAGSFRLVQHQIGKTLTFRLTGPPAAMAMQMGVFGTDVYTMDSSLEAAAVHAGAIQPGKTGLVRVTILGPQPGFQGSVRNGIASHPYGPWAGFRIEQPRGGAGKK